MNLTFKQFLAGILWFITLLPVFIINTQVQNGYDYWPFQSTNFLIILFSIWQIFSFRKNVAFNTNTMLYLFVYFFLGIAPLYQFASRVTIWGGVSLTGFDFFYTNFIIIVALLFYQYSYKIFYHKRIKNLSSHSCDIYQIAVCRRKIYPVLLSFFSLGVTLAVFQTYPILLFFREFNDGEKIIFDTFGNTSLNLIYTIVIRPIPVLVLAYYNLIYKKFDFLASFLLIIVLITNFPLSLPRFYIAGVYLPLLISYYPKLLRREYIFKVLIFFGVLYVFPFLNQGRTVTDIDKLDLSFTLNYEMFLEGHFDSFQNFTRVLIHNTITYGRQLWGVLLFWVPRSLYENKPIGSGGYIAEEYNLNFDHISLNYWGEGWINFGLSGVLLFSVFLAYLNARFDADFLSGKNSLCRNMMYYIYMGFIFFILRGDLISGFAYTVGVLLSSYLTYKVFVRREKANI